MNFVSVWVNLCCAVLILFIIVYDSCDLSSIFAGAKFHIYMLLEAGQLFDRNIYIYTHFCMP